MVAGDGPPVLLLHGFASDHGGNWGAPGIMGSLIAAGRTVIASDARGHGQSGKPHDPAAYAAGTMERDAQAVLDACGIEGDRSVDVVGYSMGALVAARLVTLDARVCSVVLGGVGGDLVAATLGISEAMAAEDPATIADPVTQAFRRFTDFTGADRMALAALDQSTCLRDPVDFDAIQVPVLVVKGLYDDMSGPPEALAARLADATVVILPGDHLGAVAEPGLTTAIVDFTSSRGAGPRTP